MGEEPEVVWFGWLLSFDSSSPHSSPPEVSFALLGPVGVGDVLGLDVERHVAVRLALLRLLLRRRRVHTRSNSRAPHEPQRRLSGGKRKKNGKDKR